MPHFQASNQLRKSPGDEVVEAVIYEPVIAKIGKFSL